LRGAQPLPDPISLMAAFGWAEPLDAQVAFAIAKLATPGLRAFMEGLSAAHGPRGIAVLTAGVAALLVAGRQRADALWLLLVVFGGAALNHLLKHTIQRPRPGMEHLNAVATDFSFPSGHAANTTLLYGALVVLLIGHVRTPGLRALVAVFAGSAVLLVGSSRLVLGAHRFSDVAAGVLLGVLVLAAGVGVRRALQR
jgi:membrane-associated phospholipid phosphatase